MPSAETSAPSAPPVVLRDGRLTLRPPRESDVPAITAACQDRDLHRWLEALPDPYLPEHAQEFVAKQAAAWKQQLGNGQERVFAITAADGGRLLGMVGFHDLAELAHPTGGRGEIGFWVTADARGAGVMTDAARLVCAYGFGELGLARIEWQAEVGNWGSRRVVDKLGFTFEGTCLGRLIHVGDRVDGWLAGLQRSEFEAGARPSSDAPVLETAGLRLRPWTLGDAADVLVLSQDPDSQRWSPSLSNVHNLNEAAAWVVERTRPNSWAVTDAETGVLVGRVGLHHLAPEARSAEIDYGVMPGWRRRGVARRAVDRVSAYAFAPDGLGLIRVSLNHGLGNDGSCAVASACGYPLEGVQRQAISAPGGTFSDAHLHARLATDQPAP